MSAKRAATTELNHYNWDAEEKTEEKGTFAEASSEELKNRVIKKARRKLTGENQTDGGVKPDFSSFKGFGSSVASASTVSSTSSPFSFLSKFSSTSSPMASTSEPSKSLAATSTPEPSKSITATSSSSSSATTATGAAISAEKTDDKWTTSSTYYAKLKGLNQAVSNWIKKHVDENPLCDLTPIFKDYEKHLKNIEETCKNGDHESTLVDKNKLKNDTFKTPFSTTSATSPNPFTNVSSSSSATGNSFSTSKSVFGSPPSTTTSSSSATFSFGIQKTSDLPKSSGFSFASSPANKPFTFGAQVSQQSSTTTKNEKDTNAAGPSSEVNNDEDDDEPPKVEFKPVVEEDSIYSKRCKVFIKNDQNYADLGVGTLHLKPVKDKDKTQLLVRADTSLGNILLNLILSDGIPTTRMGKNNVMMICIPTPDKKAPVTVLLRVKTGEEADELIETINKYKK